MRFHRSSLGHPFSLKFCCGCVIDRRLAYIFPVDLTSSEKWRASNTFFGLSGKIK